MLNNDILSIILNLLDDNDWMNFRLTCRNIYYLPTYQELCQRLLKYHYKYKGRCKKCGDRITKGIHCVVCYGKDICRWCIKEEENCCLDDNMILQCDNCEYGYCKCHNMMRDCEECPGRFWITGICVPCYDKNGGLCDDHANK